MDRNAVRVALALDLPAKMGRCLGGLLRNLDKADQEGGTEVLVVEALEAA
jgi:hypothetical protein